MRQRTAVMVAASVVLAGSGGTIAGEPCTESYWDNTIGVPGFDLSSGSSGDGLVHALAVFDDGSGPQLYAGGSFDLAGGNFASRIARWDGTQWNPLLGESMQNGTNGRVEAMLVFDDGSGPALYAGGVFDIALGVPASKIFRFDGTTATPLGGGLSGPTGSRVLCMATFDDGTGPALYVGGNFTGAAGGSITGLQVARWDGTSWSSVGTTSFNNSVNALAVYNDGTGPALYAGGFFNGRVVKWDGSTWSVVGGGVGNFISWVNDLVVFDDGSGPALYAVGAFEEAGGQQVNNIAKWDGVSWSGLGDGCPGGITLGCGITNAAESLAVFDDGTGEALFVDANGAWPDGEFVDLRRTAKWDGSHWTPLSDGVSWNVPGTRVRAMTTYDDGSGPALVVAGGFNMAGGEPVNHIAMWRPCDGVDPAIPGDLNGDNVVDSADLLEMLANWGACTDCENCPADLTGDCEVDSTDLLILLSAWTT